MSDVATYTKRDQILDLSAHKPHLVILGAGASRQCCPHGDKFGRKLPVMLDLVDTLHLEDTLDRAKIPHKDRNFEDIYSQIACNPNLAYLKRKVENTVSDYFSKLVLPEEPTIYDYLVLSLRPKDAIATFNWDPFLYQALERNSGHATLPRYFFLHGCAAIGYCNKDRRQGRLGGRCPICRKPFKPTKLLYPTNKNYTSDPYIRSQWRSVMAYLQNAFLLTIFGYGAPENDAAAVDLMSKAWGTPERRRFEQIEMIDIKTEDELTITWDRFIHTHHYSVTSDYYSSILSSHPRRSVETFWQQLIHGRFCDENRVPRVNSIHALWEWFETLIRVERGEGLSA